MGFDLHCDLFTSLGAEAGISKSEISTIGAELDCDVSAFNTRDLVEQTFSYTLLGTSRCKALSGHKHGKGARVASQAAVIASGVRRRAARGVGVRGRGLRNPGLLVRLPVDSV